MKTFTVKHKSNETMLKSNYFMVLCVFVIDTAIKKIRNFMKIEWFWSKIICLLAKLRFWCPEFLVFLIIISLLDSIFPKENVPVLCEKFPQKFWLLWDYETVLIWCITVAIFLTEMRVHWQYCASYFRFTAYYRH